MARIETLLPSYKFTELELHGSNSIAFKAMQFAIFLSSFNCFMTENHLLQFPNYSAKWGLKFMTLTLAMNHY